LNSDCFLSSNRAFISAQSSDRKAFTAAGNSSQVLALILDEVMYGEVEVLAQEFPVCQDVINSPRKAAQPSGLQPVLSLNVAEALCRSGIAQS
jgi:hypothetical protein